jgi:hypothetical protein
MLVLRCLAPAAAAAADRLERRQLGYLLARQGVQLNLEEGTAAVEVRLVRPIALSFAAAARVGGGRGAYMAARLSEASPARLSEQRCAVHSLLIVAPVKLMRPAQLT